MAVKWAVANGNWNAGATWNDGVIPTIDDEVYLNGHAISIVTNNTTAKFISNGVCPNTSNSGGYLLTSLVSDIYITANLLQRNGRLFLKSNNGQCKIFVTGDVSNLNNYIFECNHGSGLAQNSFIITGNVTANYELVHFSYPGNVKLNLLQVIGTLEVNASTLYSNVNNSNNGIVQLIVSGELKTNLKQNYVIDDGTIDGKITSKGLVFFTNLTINGIIEYTSTDKSFGINYTNQLLIQNPDTFTWKDITEPRSNPFIIITNADMNNHQQYPPEDEVKEGTEYVWGEKVGTYTPDYPPESVVLKDYEYGDSDDRKTGTMVQEVNVEVGCVTKEDVRKDVPLVGMGVVGSLVVPSADDVREGVVFDNGSVGTLIVQGGGDRLRIADFGYYTNAQSDTYIVDLTEQDKPKFAVAEERVLIEMFPDLDLNNIPDKYFDDLFVKYLKYRLIVEYYRTAGINSTFTPSEPTTEIVNYQNVRNEVWLNSANIYLKAWGKKYPESITKPQRILL